MHGEEKPPFLRFCHCTGDELFKSCHAHDCRIDDLSLQKRLCGTQFRHSTGFIDKFNLERIGFGHRNGLFVTVEVVCLHARHVSSNGLVPNAVAMRIVTSIVLDSVRSAAVGVALTKHRVHRRALYLVVAGTDCLFFVRGRSIRVIRQSITVLLEFGNRGLELRHRSRNIRKLDDVRIWFKRELAEEREVIRHRLTCKHRPFRERILESCENTSRQGDVLGFDIDICCLCKSRYNREQRLSRQERRLVCKGVIDFSIHTPLR